MPLPIVFLIWRYAMLVINVGEIEVWNKKTEEFEYVGGTPVSLEHSLWSMAQWETKWKIPFMRKDEPLTLEQFQDYLNFMSRDGVVPISELTEKNVKDIQEYLNGEHTAAVVTSHETANTGQFMTSDLIYASMTIAGVDWEAQYWPLSRLTMLLKIIGEMKSEKKKMSPQQLAQQNAEINRKRREALKTKG